MPIPARNRTFAKSHALRQRDSHIEDYLEKVVAFRPAFRIDFPSFYTAPARL
jgi:hypothetical protein